MRGLRFEGKGGVNVFELCFVYDQRENMANTNQCCVFAHLFNAYLKSLDANNELEKEPMIYEDTHVLYYLYSATKGFHSKDVCAPSIYFLFFFCFLVCIWFVLLCYRNMVGHR